MPIVFETFQEFTERMGSTPIQVVGGWLFVNGAQSDGNINHYVPAPGSVEARENQHLFAKEKLKQVRSDLARLQTGVDQQIDWHRKGFGPSPDSTVPGWRNEIKRLRKRVEIAELCVRVLARRLPDQQANKFQEEIAQQRHLAMNEAQRELNEVQVYVGGDD